MMRPSGKSRLPIGDLILSEALQGFCSDADYQPTESLLLGLAAFELLGQDLAVKAADHYRALRRLRVTVRKTLDCMNRAGIPGGSKP